MFVIEGGENQYDDEVMHVVLREESRAVMHVWDRAETERQTTVVDEGAEGKWPLAEKGGRATIPARVRPEARGVVPPLNYAKRNTSAKSRGWGKPCIYPVCLGDRQTKTACSSCYQ